jgi:hypothetical protein
MKLSRAAATPWWATGRSHKEHNGETAINKSIYLMQTGQPMAAQDGSLFQVQRLAQSRSL